MYITCLETSTDFTVCDRQFLFDQSIIDGNYLTAVNCKGVLCIILGK